MNFHQTCGAKILHAHQLGFSSRGKIAHGLNTQQLQGFSAANAQIERANRHAQHAVGHGALHLLKHFAAHLVIVAAIKLLTQAQTARGQHLLDLHQTGLAKILIRQQFGFTNAKQIAKRANVHLLQTIARADRKFKLRHWQFKHGFFAALQAREFLVVQHVLAGLHVANEQLCARVIWIGLKHLLDQLAGARELSRVLQQN